MAESRLRAGKIGKRRRRPRALLLAGAVIAIVLSGLFMTRSASAAPAATSATAAHIAKNQVTALVNRSALTAGICNVPGVGDIGGLVGLCNAGSGLVSDLNNICTSGAPAPELATSGLNSMI